MHNITNKPSNKSTDNKPKPHHNEELLKEKEAAAYLTICPQVLRKWRAQKKISYIRFGRAVRYKLQYLDKFIDSHRIG